MPLDLAEGQEYQQIELLSLTSCAICKLKCRRVCFGSVAGNNRPNDISVVPDLSLCRKETAV